MPLLPLFLTYITKVRTGLECEGLKLRILECFDRCLGQPKRHKPIIADIISGEPLLFLSIREPAPPPPEPLTSETSLSRT
jgi:hypothetical protein